MSDGTVELELSVGDLLALAVDDERRNESERLAEPLDRCPRVVVAQGRIKNLNDLLRRTTHVGTSHLGGWARVRHRRSRFSVRGNRKRDDRGAGQ